MDTAAWFILIVVLILFEIFTMGLTTIWFALGAVIALIASLAGANLVVQIVLFFVISLGSLIITRPIAQKYINDRAVKTNVDSMIGKTGKVVELIDNINATGHIMVEGNQWMARSTADNTTIEVDSLVTIVRIDGVKAIVEKL